jgi:hypothetical protein
MPFNRCQAFILAGKDWSAMHIHADSQVFAFVNSSESHLTHFLKDQGTRISNLKVTMQGVGVLTHE